ncbi:MAG: hypothetical protein M1827_002132 [Pycnora praestabilis]|nr:MAG: hypothetical protein M1827_002132 [Pycnora praestabilis]
MSTALPSDEVAEDYKNALEDLALNSRYDISNLTIIAKENTEHAMAISRVLENHIRNAPPDRKLPALYVVDSIVKNIGTPYTLFFGRNLYQTFMNAYLLVGAQTRKNMDAMLKTWKEPVPGSLDTRPVFPIDVTRGIENALIKARTAAVKQEQQSRNQQRVPGRPNPMATPQISWRNTPTPPQYAGRYAPPQAVNLPTQTNGNGTMTQQLYHEDRNSNGLASSPFPPTGYGVAAVLSASINTLNNDLANLISSARADFAANPYDQGLQTQLKALLDLQSILQSQQLPPEQIQKIRDQVAQLSLSVQSQRPQPSPPIPQPVPPQPTNLQPPTLQSMFPANALADLLASTTRSQQPTPPPPQSAISLPQPHTQFNPPPTPQPAPANDGLALLASLRAAGMLPPVASTPTIAPAIPAMIPLPFQFPPPPPPPHNIRGLPTLHSNLARPALAEIPNDVEMTSSSLKISRPHLIKSLYEAQPNQCTSCGRRFLLSEEGKKKKARHLDWHFKVNQRMADAVQRGQSRSWYVDEMEWIESRDNDEETITTTGTSNSSNFPGAAAAAAAASKLDPKNQYIPAPNDPTHANVNCPICQEKFETVWHDEAQEWVWMDAVKVGGRIFHASCHAEASKDGGGMGKGAETVLGKRKAEEIDLNALRAKIKMPIV